MKMLEIIETETDFSVVDDTLREPEHELVQRSVPVRLAATVRRTARCSRPSACSS